MKINRIKIENFRSIQQTEFKTTNFNIFVGQNNCGKTNFFEALEFFFNGLGKSTNLNELRYKRDVKNEILVEVEFIGAQESTEKMQNEKNKITIQNKLNGSDVVVFTRDSKDIKKRKMFVNGAEISPGTGFDTALNDFLPKFEYIKKQYYDSVAKYARTTPIGIMLSGVLSTILQSNQQYQDFQIKFSGLFESDTSQIKTEFEAIENQVEKNEGKTEIELVSEKEKPYIVYGLLGGSPSDLLLAKNAGRS